MNKIQFTNLVNGVELVDKTTRLHYRLRYRISRKMVLERITPYISAPVIQIIHTAKQALDWEFIN